MERTGACHTQDKQPVTVAQAAAGAVGLGHCVMEGCSWRMHQETVLDQGEHLRLEALEAAHRVVTHT